jgi:hypothetical protein
MAHARNHSCPTPLIRNGAALHLPFVILSDELEFLIIDLLSDSSGASSTVANVRDVLAFDSDRHDLYVAGEFGQVSLFRVGTGSVRRVAEAVLAPTRTSSRSTRPRSRCIFST